MDNCAERVPRRISQTLLNALKGGVVPRVGLPYIAVGRKNEIEALLHDVDIIKEGGASFRFVVGKYGAGKSFLLQIIRNYVMDRNFIVLDADLSPERRLRGSQGQGLATYRELIRNLSTKTKPDGGALMLILDRWINTAQTNVVTANPAFNETQIKQTVDQQIYEITASMGELVHGFEFAKLLITYYHAYINNDEDKRNKVLRWFKGEYTTKNEAKNELNVNIIITDEDWYDYIKLFALFFRLSGYSGMMVMIDELVNIAKIPNAVTRQYNYEKMLTIYNDTLQGRAQYIGFIMGATPQTLEDKHRGIYSYEALQSRLAESKFARPGYRDMLAPVIRLEPLTAEEMLVLCEKLTHLHADLYNYQTSVVADDLVAFIKTEYARIGADSHITPREIIRDFIEVLDILYQKPSLRLCEIIQSDTFAFTPSVAIQDEADEQFATFSL